jgi:hypothetical protein
MAFVALAVLLIPPLEPARAQSCAGICGQNAGGCYCDDMCEGPAYNDCCADKTYQCGSASPAGDDCGTPVDVPTTVGALPYSSLDNTIRDTPSYDYGANVCPGESAAFGANGADHVYRFIPEVDGAYTFNLNPAPGYDAGLYMLLSCPVPINDDACLSAHRPPGDAQSTLQSVYLLKNVPIFIVVDGAPNQTGGFEFTADCDRNACGTCGAPPNELCGDAGGIGIDEDCDGTIDEGPCTIDDLQVTLKLRIAQICKPGERDTCGYASIAAKTAHDERQKHFVALVNRNWSPTGIAFRPEIFTHADDIGRDFEGKGCETVNCNGNADCSGAEICNDDGICGLPCTVDTDCTGGLRCIKNAAGDAPDGSLPTAAICSCQQRILEKRYCPPDAACWFQIQGYKPSFLFSGWQKRAAYSWVRETRTDYIGNLLAHELGHLFGLDHPFRDYNHKDDTGNQAQPGGLTLKEAWDNGHDADGLASTPPDPGRAAKFKETTCSADTDCAGGVGSCVSGRCDCADDTDCAAGTACHLRGERSPQISSADPTRKTCWSGDEFSGPTQWRNPATLKVGNRYCETGTPIVDQNGLFKYWVPLPTGNADPSSPIPKYYQAPRCYWNTDGGLLTYAWAPFAEASNLPANWIDPSEQGIESPHWGIESPDWFNAMAYNSQRGPMVLNGQRYESFTDQQRAKIWAALYSCGTMADGIPQLLLDIFGDDEWLEDRLNGYRCGNGQAKCYCDTDSTKLMTLTEARAVCRPRCGQHQALLAAPACPVAGDVDRDGVCDDVDLCKTPSAKDIGMGLEARFSIDSNGDGLADPCEPCPSDPTPNLVDYDEDGLFGTCDNDQDNDGCLDADDDDLSRDTIVLYPGACGDELQFAGEDLDQDGLLNCEDSDDDNDGIPDSMDTCNQVPAIPYTPTICIERPCDTPFPPLDPNNPVDCRRFGRIGCDLWKFDLFDTYAPPSVPDLPFFEESEIFAFFDARLYLRTNNSKTPSEQLLRLGQRIAGLTGSSPTLTLQITQGSLLLVERTIDRSQLIIDPTGGGRLIELTLPTTADPNTTLRTVWTLPGAKDTDGDTVPDVLDNCTEYPNPRQFDRDKDGFGNLCDPDLDNDDKVEVNDGQWIQDCLGWQVERYAAVGEGTPSPSEAEVAAALHCNAADLDDDGVVTLSDYYLIYHPLLGGPPGPSAFGGL